MSVTPADVRAAVDRVRQALAPTPSVWSERLGAWLKLESLQPTGAFKVRGAVNAVARQREAGDGRPVVAASAGNHALGVAWACRRFGLLCRVVVPEGAPRAKADACARLGARVDRVGETFDEALEVARELASRGEGRFLHAFDDPDVIAGQGTLALELPETDAVLVPVAGGSLAAGVGLALEGARLIGVQVEGLESLRRDAPPAASVADGLRVRTAGRLAKRLCEDVLHEIVVVSERDVRREMGALAACDRVLAEGAGAAAVAALPLVRARRPLAVVTGGNVDLEVLSRIWKEETCA